MIWVIGIYLSLIHICGDDLEVAKYQVFTTVVEEINKAVKAFTADKAAKKPSTNQSENEKTYDVLSKVDFCLLYTSK